MAITINVNLDEILAALKNDLDFTGNADKYIKVNATADGFEFAAVSVGSTWGSITGTLSDQTDLQSALDLKANLAGASFTGDVSVTTSGSGDTLQLTNSGSGTTLNITNSGSGDFLTIDSTKLVIDNGGDVSIGTATASARFHVLTGSTSKVGAIIQAAAGQTANLLEINSNGGSGGDLLNVNSIGGVTLNATTSSNTRHLSIRQYNNGIQAAALTFSKARGSLSSPADVNALDLVAGVTFSARVGGAFTQDRSLFGASMATSTGIGIFFIAGSTNNNYVPNMYIHPSGEVTIGQGGSIVSGGVPVNGSAKLQVDSTTQGFLPPRMTGAQVEAISTPAEGLIAYATNAGAGDVTAKGLYIYNGTNWVSL